MVKNFSQDNIKDLTYLLKQNSGKEDVSNYSIKKTKSEKFYSPKKQLTAEEKLVMVKNNKKTLGDSFVKNNRTLLQNLFKYSYLWIVSFAFAFSVLQFGDSAISTFQGALFNIIASFKS